MGRTSSSIKESGGRKSKTKTDASQAYKAGKGKSNALAKRNQYGEKVIPEPKGYPGKGAGYVLRTEMGLKDNKDEYLYILRVARKHINARMDITKSFRQQSYSSKLKVARAIAKEIPKIVARYADAWPIFAIMKTFLANAKSRNKDRAQEEHRGGCETETEEIERLGILKAIRSDQGISILDSILDSDESDSDASDVAADSEDNDNDAVEENRTNKWKAPNNGTVTECSKAQKPLADKKNRVVVESSDDEDIASTQPARERPKTGKRKQELIDGADLDMSDVEAKSSARKRAKATTNSRKASTRPAREPDCDTKLRRSAWKITIRVEIC